MATRPDSNLRHALQDARTVITSTLAIGRVVKDGTSDGQAQITTDGVGAIGVVTELGKTAGAVGDVITICLLAGGAVVPVLVGTGGATRGKLAKVVADGVTDAVPAGAGTTAVEICGKFTQTGVAGDLVGMVPFSAWVTA